MVTELVQVYAPLAEGVAHGEHFALPRLDYLQKVESNVQQIEQLVTGETYCIDIIQRAQQVKGALERFNARVLSDHLNGCITDAIRGDRVAEREHKLRELLELFTTANTLQAI